jgi:hypothetical protein
VLADALQGAPGLPEDMDSEGRHDQRQQNRACRADIDNLRFFPGTAGQPLIR